MEQRADQAVGQEAAGAAQNRAHGAVEGDLAYSADHRRLHQLHTHNEAVGQGLVLCTDQDHREPWAPACTAIQTVLILDACQVCGAVHAPAKRSNAHSIDSRSGVCSPHT